MATNGYCLIALNELVWRRGAEAKIERAVKLKDRERLWLGTTSTLLMELLTEIRLRRAHLQARLLGLSPPTWKPRETLKEETNF